MENTNELSELQQQALLDVTEYFKDSLKATTKETLKQKEQYELTERGKEAKALQLVSQLYELGYEYYNADGTPVIKVMKAGQLKAEDIKEDKTNIKVVCEDLRIRNFNINELIKETKIDTNLISDGYHTFGELYEHRIVNFIAICKLIAKQDYKRVWLADKHSDGTSWNGWFILGIDYEAGKQITYHLPFEKRLECRRFALDIVKAPKFDGHTSSDVLERLAQL